MGAASTQLHVVTAAYSKSYESKVTSSTDTALNYELVMFCCALSQFVQPSRIPGLRTRGCAYLLLSCGRVLHVHIDYPDILGRLVVLTANFSIFAFLGRLDTPKGVHNILRSEMLKTALQIAMKYVIQDAVDRFLMHLTKQRGYLSSGMLKHSVFAL
jgi:hypothetical protein